VDTSITTGTLVVTGNSSLNGITAGNINFTGNLYQNGSLYSPSSSPVYGIYNQSGGQSGSNYNLAPYMTTSTAMSGVTLSSSGWTNTSGSTLIVQLSYTIILGGITVNCQSPIGIQQYTGFSNNYYTCSASGIFVWTNGTTFTLTVTGDCGIVPSWNHVYISLLH